MARSAVLFIALVLALPAIACQPAGRAARPAPTLSMPSDGQLFDVRFTLVPASPPAPDTCATMPQFRDTFEQTVFQFAFSGAGPALQVQIDEAGRTTPTALAIQAPMPVTDQGGVLRFADATLRTAQRGALPLGDVAGPGMFAVWRLPVHFTQGELRVAAAPPGNPSDRLDVTVVQIAGSEVRGDVGAHCIGMTIGVGQRVTARPVAFFGLACNDGVASPGACPLLADGTVGVWFSEPVLLQEVASHLFATDGQGQPVPLTVTAPATLGYGLVVQGVWPLGGTVRLLLARGVPDRTGNRATALQATFPVVADPGDLGDAGNTGFERGDLTGYTVSRWRDTLQLTPDTLGHVMNSRGPMSAGPGAPLASVVPRFHGVRPSAGGFMAALGRLDADPPTEVEVTARLWVPAGATALVLDYDLVTELHSAGGGRPLLRVSLRSAGGLTQTSTDSPAAQEFTPLDEQTAHSGWHQLTVPLRPDQAGQTVVLTLHARPGDLVAPPWPSGHGVLLVDHLRFA